MMLTDKTALQADFAEKGILNLSDVELDALQAAVENLTGPVPGRGKIANPYNKSAFAILEQSGDDNNPSPRFALDEDSFQIMRVQDKTKTDVEWQRYGLQRNKQDDGISPFAHPHMYKDVDLGKDVPEVANYLNQLFEEKTRVVAMLGAARVHIGEGMLLIEPIQKIVAGLANVAYMTGGYRGQGDKRYGVTRAGFSVPKSMDKKTLIVMPQAGAKDSHQAADAKSFYGEQWGDDTPALAAACDGAIFFRNIPSKIKYGAWTEVEIANFIKVKKPIVILDPDAAEGHELLFGQNISVVNTPEKVVTLMQAHLPMPEEVAKRAPIAPIGDIHDSQLHEQNWIAVRLNYRGHHLARWVMQSSSVFEEFRAKGLHIPEPDNSAFRNGHRNLALDGYWKDVMLLQHYQKMHADYDSLSDLLDHYVFYRNELAPLEEKEGIGFLYISEHSEEFIRQLRSLPDDEYRTMLSEMKETI